jgi:hypothetical protein
MYIPDSGHSSEGKRTVEGLNCLLRLDRSGRSWPRRQTYAVTRAVK